MNIDEIVKKLYIPPLSSHKGQNGRLLIIGGSKLFHAASLWSLKVASRIVDLVHYASTEENNKIVQKLKEEFRDGIVVSRSDIESYIEEDDCILIGPGMVRAQREVSGIRYQVSGMKDIEKMTDEGMQTYYLTKYLLNKYPKKKWVIDAGALQMLNPADIPTESILTPHKQEFARLIAKISNIKSSVFAKATSDKQISNKSQIPNDKYNITEFAKKYHCTILLKGETDYIASDEKFIEVAGGNAGMTKGGTGDVLAGLVAAFYCKNDAFTSAVAASYINKCAGDDLYQKSGYWFNASDLADQIPQTMKELLL